MTDLYTNIEGTEGTGGTSLFLKENIGSPSEGTPGNPGNRLALETIDPTETPPEQLPEPEVKRPSFVTHDDWFQLNGAKLRPGLYFHSLSKGEDPKPVDEWVCSPIHALAISATEAGAGFGLLLRFRNPYGQWREWAAPMHLLKGSGEELRGELLDLGVRIDPQKTRLLNNWLMNQYPKRRVIAALRTGWHGRAFVLPNRVIGSEDVRFQSEHAAHDDYTQAGTLEGWRDQVAAPCRGNPIMLLAVSTAFAGPLLKLAKRQEMGGAGIHLMGDSSKGKSSAQLAASSVWGAPGFKRTWRGTANGLEATAAALNDTLLVLDEIGEIDPREIGTVVYALANGAGKQRARRTGGARESARWRIITLSSGEHTLAVHMREGGKRIKAGQEARMLDVPATNRAYGVFDCLHGHLHGRAIADAVRDAAAAHYGHAGPAFVEALLRDTQDLPALYIATCNLPAFQSRDGVEARAAGTFALVGMAGELATEYGLTGWTAGEAMQAAIHAFNSWRAFRGAGQTEDRQILRGVRDFIQCHGDSRFSDLVAGDTQTVPVRDRAGYWRDTPDGRLYLFNSPGLQAAAPGFDIRRILDALTSAGWIAEHDSGKRSKKVKVAGDSMNLYAIRTVEGDEL